MIRHIAVFRFKPEFGETERQAWIDMIAALPQEIPEIRAMSIGKDTLHGPHSYDIGLVADFNDYAAMEAYNAHPAHQKVLDVSGPVKEHLAVVDFEFTP